MPATIENKVDCGYNGINQQKCETKGCCWALPEKNTYSANVPGVGGWGGKYRCPDGKEYWVGDNGDACRSLAGEGGERVGGCIRHDGIWSRHKVKCAPKVEPGTPYCFYPKQNKPSFLEQKRSKQLRATTTSKELIPFMSPQDVLRFFDPYALMEEFLMSFIDLLVTIDRVFEWNSTVIAKLKESKDIFQLMVFIGLRIFEGFCGRFGMALVNIVKAFFMCNAVCDCECPVALLRFNKESCESEPPQATYDPVKAEEVYQQYQNSVPKNERMLKTRNGFMSCRDQCRRHIGMNGYPANSKYDRFDSDMRFGKIIPAWDTKNYDKDKPQKRYWPCCKVWPWELGRTDKGHICEACQCFEGVSKSRDVGLRFFGSEEEISKASNAGYAKDLCVRVNEPGDKGTRGYHSNENNYLCTKENIGLKWSYAGKLANMNCERIDEPSAWARVWDDNYICLPYDSKYELKWSNNGSHNWPKDEITHFGDRSAPGYESWGDDYLWLRLKAH